VAGYFLVANRHRLPINEDFESNTNVFHFLGNGVSPDGIAILFVKLESFFDGLRHLDTKFMGPFQVTRISLLHEQDDAVSLFEDMRHPPVKSWFMVNANYLSKFGNFNRMRFLEVREVRLRGGTVFPLAAQLPANGRTPQVGPTIGTHNFLVCKFNCRVCASVVNNFIQKDILKPIGVILGVQGLRNHISGQLGLVAIVKMNDIGSCV
jgi:hypothetical protein